MERHVFIFNPKNYDFLCASIIEGLNDLGIPYSAIRKTNYASKNILDRKWREISKNDILLDFTNSKRVRQFLRKLGHPNVYRVDGSDQVATALLDCDLYRGLFKREFLSAFSDRSSDCVWPMPFAAENRYFLTPSSSRDIHLSCMLDKKNKPFRSVVQAHLTSRAQDNWFVGTTGERAGRMKLGHSLPTPVYHDILSRSRVSVSVMGAGYDCGRFWEVPSAQVALLSQAIPIQIPHPFHDGVDAVFFETIEELNSRIDELQRGKLDWESIAQAGFEHVQKFHKSSQRAFGLLEHVKESIQSGARAEWGKIEKEAWGMSLFDKTFKPK